jgi:plasmid rolling circle replication initiator protein Rep
LSETESDESFAAIVPPTPESLQQSESLGLADLSDRDQVWDKHRANADKVSNHYRGSKGFNQYSQRIDFCSQLLDFRLVPEPEEGILKLKLSASRFCRVRTCPVCQWRRSLMWKAKAYQALPKVVKDFPKHRWLFLTLTVKNCPVEELRSTLTHLNKSFVRLTKLKDWPADGWIKSVEVTRGRDGNAHPHLHALLMVPASYFGAAYVSQQRWVEMWRSSARLDYNPQTHVRAIAKNHNPTEIVPEILKYQVKESDLVANREWFLELSKQLHKTRAVAVGGVLRGYMKELECEPEDLIGNTNEGEVDEGHLYFGWKRKQKKYKWMGDQK